MACLTPNRSVHRVTLIAAVLVLLCLLTFPALAKNVYQDPDERFSVRLPDGWELTQEQLNLIYKFEGKEASASLLVRLFTDPADLEEIFAAQVENMTAAEYAEPPADAICDLEVNGCPARWVQYPFEVEASGMTVTLIASLGGGVCADQGGIGFLSFMSPDDQKRVGKKIETAFQSLQLHTSLRSAAAAPVVEAGAASGGAFTHELVQLTLPAGWSATPGKDETIATLSHPEYGTLTVMGAPAEKFGKDRQDIHKNVRYGLMTSLPSMHTITKAAEQNTDGGLSILVEELLGKTSASGIEVSLGAIVASAKETERGLGFLGIFNTKVRDLAYPEMLAILKSLR